MIPPTSECGVVLCAGGACDEVDRSNPTFGTRGSIIVHILMGLCLIGRPVSKISVLRTATDGRRPRYRQRMVQVDRI